MRRPSFQFYPGDWVSNQKLRRCTLEERGLWMEVMCLMHDSDEYGVLRWPLADIALSISGASIGLLESLCRKGVLKGKGAFLPIDAPKGGIGAPIVTNSNTPLVVVSAQPGAASGVASGEDTGLPLVYTPMHARKKGPPVILLEWCDGDVWFSPRMVIDEHLRQTRAKYGELSVNNPEASRKKEPPAAGGAVSPIPPMGAAKGVVKTDPKDSQPARQLAETNEPTKTSTRVAEEMALPSVILTDGSEWLPTDEDIASCLVAYPGCDLKSEFAKMHLHLSANPQTRPVSRPLRFVQSWLAKSQNQMAARSSSSSAATFSWDGVSFGFKVFVEAYPGHRQGGLADAWSAWKRISPSPDEHPEAAAAIMSGLDAWIKSGDWHDESGQYVPKASNFLSDRKWASKPRHATPNTNKMTVNERISHSLEKGYKGPVTGKLSDIVK